MFYNENSQRYYTEDALNTENKKKDMSDIKERNINLSEKHEAKNKTGVESGFFLKCCYEYLSD